MPWFLNPNIYNKLPVYQNPELYLFIAKLAAAAMFAFLLWKKGIRGRRLLATTFIFFYGTFITVMLFMHNMVILGLRVFERADNSNFSYDFHLYSLILLGTLLFLQGVRSLRAAFLLKAGDESGIREASRAISVVLVIAIPLIPIQFFGTVLTVFSLLNLGIVKFLLPRASISSKADAERNPFPVPNLGFHN